MTTGEEGPTDLDLAGFGPLGIESRRANQLPQSVNLRAAAAGEIAKNKTQDYEVGDTLNLPPCIQQNGKKSKLGIKKR